MKSSFSRLGLVGMATALALCTASASVSFADTEKLPTYQQWQADVTKVMAPATDWLRDRAGQSDSKLGGDRLAIVLDIDNTSLETEYHRGHPDKPVLTVAQWAHDHGYAILFATGRKVSGYDETLGELTDAGYDVDGLCMKTSEDGSNSATKQRCRAEYTSDGYTITANIGNRPTDFEGGDYEKRFQLPDYDGQLS